MGVIWGKGECWQINALGERHKGHGDRQALQMMAGSAML